MASIGREGNNGERKRIMFRNAQNKQQTLRLGKCSERAAQSALVGLERIIEAHRLGTTLHPDGVRWLESIGDDLHERVVRLGLGVEPRKGTATVTLGELLARFEASAVVKQSTLTAYRQTTASLLEFLGDRTPLDTITPANADAWRKSMADSGLAAATVSKRCQNARTIFRRAVRWGLMTTSPFADLRSGPQSNPERAFYVDAETTKAVLNACPDDQWRAIVALSRFAGLRCPSEVVALRWADVNWAKGRLTVRSPKTSGHEGHAVRVVPIDPRLRPILDRLFDAAEPGAEAVVPRLRDGKVNLRTHLYRILHHAGLKPWPRLYHNLRASCACDWTERFPAHVVANWLGHSPLIAARHYLQTRDVHFDMAAGLAEGGNKSGNSAATNAATHALPRDTTREQPDSQTLADQDTLGVGGVRCDPTNTYLMSDTGLEPVTSSVSWKRASQLRQSPGMSPRLTGTSGVYHRFGPRHRLPAELRSVRSRSARAAASLKVQSPRS